MRTGLFSQWLETCGWENAHFQSPGAPRLLLTRARPMAAQAAMRGVGAARPSPARPKLEVPR